MFSPFRHQPYTKERSYFNPLIVNMDLYLTGNTVVFYDSYYSDLDGISDPIYLMLIKSLERVYNNDEFFFSKHFLRLYLF